MIEEFDLFICRSATTLFHSMDIHSNKFSNNSAKKKGSPSLAGSSRQIAPSPIITTKPALVLKQSPSKALKSWDELQVQEWLKMHGLSKFIANFRGISSWRGIINR